MASRFLLSASSLRPCTFTRRTACYTSMAYVEARNWNSMCQQCWHGTECINSLTSLIQQNATWSSLGSWLALIPLGRSTSGVIVLGQARGLKSVETGLRAGDIIHSLNQTSIDSVAEL